MYLCRYNNKTYRIDEIAWDHTPNNTFTRGDKDISFKDYYKMVAVMHSTHFSVLFLNWYNNSIIVSAHSPYDGLRIGIGHQEGTACNAVQLLSSNLIHDLSILHTFSFFLFLAI